MNKLNLGCLKIVRWSSWPLILVIGGFLCTGYAITGQYGLGRYATRRSR